MTTKQRKSGCIVIMVKARGIYLNGFLQLQVKSTKLYLAKVLPLSLLLCFTCHHTLHQNDTASEPLNESPFFIIGFFFFFFFPPSAMNCNPAVSVSCPLPLPFSDSPFPSWGNHNVLRGQSHQDLHLHRHRPRCYRTSHWLWSPPPQHLKNPLNEMGRRFPTNTVWFMAICGSDL